MQLLLRTRLNHRVSQLRYKVCWVHFERETNLNEFHYIHPSRSSLDFDDVRELLP